MNDQPRTLVRHERIGGSSALIPAMIADQESNVGERFIEFFTATIRNPNTREAYGRAVGTFFDWCEHSAWARQVGIANDAKGPLYRAVDRKTKTLGDQRLTPAPRPRHDQAPLP